MIPFDFYPYNEFIINLPKKNMQDFLQFIWKSSPPLSRVILHLESITKFDNLSFIDNSFKHFYFNYVLERIPKHELFSSYFRSLKRLISLEIEKFNILGITTLLDFLVHDKDKSFFDVDYLIYSFGKIDGRKVKNLFEDKNTSALIRICKNSSFKQAYTEIKDLKDFEKNMTQIFNDVERSFFSKVIGQKKFNDTNLKETVMKLAIAYYFSVILETGNIKALNHGIDSSMTKNELSNLIMEV
jgi:hypothetical protein